MASKGPPPPYTPTAAPGSSPGIEASSQAAHKSLAEQSAYPPPPGISHEFSSGTNVTAQEAEQGLRWCAANPLWPAQRISPAQLSQIHSHDHQILLPNRQQAPGFLGCGSSVMQQQQYGGAAFRIWTVQTFHGCRDTMLQTMLPLYGAVSERPRAQGQIKTIYYEVYLQRLGPAPETHKEHHHHSRLKDMFRRQPMEGAGIALGFVAPPYPCFRQPGWERGSLAVHSDDGRRFVGNNKGGIEFTSPFRVGETLGIGMTFKGRAESKHPAEDPLDVEVFLTRDGRKVGEWFMRNTDGVDENVEGVMGENDLFAAVGVFGEVEFDVVYMPSGWRFNPL